MPELDISVLIPTYARPDSLTLTLQCLADAGHEALRVSVIVIDNGSDSRTRQVAETTYGTLPVRYLREPRSGKEFALNRALAEAELGEIVAVLDDDMSVEPGWWNGVAAICARHPECDYFTGRSYIIWPRESIPGWARSPAIQTWAHSVLDCGPRDRRFEYGEWPSGNMFWVRRRVLDEGFRFDETLHPTYSIGADAEFILRLAEVGKSGVAGPDAVAGHRIQEALLDLVHVRGRAARMGRALARIRLDKPKTLPQAQLLVNRPVTFKIVRSGNLLRWVGEYVWSFTRRTADARIEQQLLAILGIANNVEALKTRRRNGS